MNDHPFLSQLLLIALLVGINGFFVMAEFSIIAARRSRIRQLAEGGDARARQVQYFHRHLDRLLSTTQIGITFACLALGWMGQRMVATLVTRWPFPWPEPVLTGITFGGIFLAIAYGQMVLGELCPKALALMHPEQLACGVAPYLHGIDRLMAPFSAGVNSSTRFLFRLIGMEITRASWSHHVTPEELKFIITTEGEALGLEAIEQNLFKNVWAFGELTAADLMTPRPQLTALTADATYGDLLALIAATGHHRFPVKGDSLDDIVGLVDFGDLALPLHQNQVFSHSPLRPWFRPPRFFPETLPLPDLLQQMQRTQTQMAIAVDEFGGTAGLICWEDLLQAVLDPTQIEEEHETNPIIQTLDDQTFLVAADLALTDLNNLLGTSLPNPENCQTLGGFLLYAWQRMPQRGETLTYGNYRFTVVAMDGPKLQQIRIHRQSSAPLPSPSLVLGSRTRN